MRGFVPQSAIDAVMPFTDTFLYDIKAIDETVHINCTGRSNRQILENLLYIDACGKKYRDALSVCPCIYVP